MTFFLISKTPGTTQGTDTKKNKNSFLNSQWYTPKKCKQWEPNMCALHDVEWLKKHWLACDVYGKVVTCVAKGLTGLGKKKDKPLKKAQNY